METATLAGGCFWCTEAIFKRIKGVSLVTPGYSGGSVPNPSYEQVCTGETGHAEAIQIKFDPKVVSFESILEIFFAAHDPTTKDRQGNDIGPQYRSIIFYHDSNQKVLAEGAAKKIPKAVTQIVPFENFYPAEDYHQNFYEKNRENPYCKVVIDPKIKKLFG